MNNRVIWVVVMVCAWFGYGCQNMNVEMPTWFDDEETTVSDQQEFTQQVTVPRSANVLEIIHYNGDIEVVGWDEPYILLQGTKRATGSTVQDARGKLEFISIYPYEKAPDRLVLEYNGPSAVLNLGRSDTGIDVKVSVPQGMPVEVNCRNGDVQMKGIQNAIKLDHRNGDVLVQDIQGIADIESHGRNVIVKNINSRVTIKTVNANLSVDGVKDNVNINHAGGEASIANVEGIIIAYGNKSHFKTKNVQGRIQIENSGGDIECDTFRSGVEVTLKNGTLHLHPKHAVAQNYNCNVDTGNIILRVPEQASMLVDIKAVKGSIQSDFTLPISAESGISSALGAVNGGDIPVSLSVKNGTISLLKDNPAARN